MAAALPRLWDIDDDPFQSFINTNNIPIATRLCLAYDKSPAAAYFTGPHSGSGLKPNSVTNSSCAASRSAAARLGTWGDDVSNERIGYAGPLVG